jgi:DNA polymerase-3 subunit delta'
MADTAADPRETAWHPRHCRQVIGHDKAIAQFRRAFESGKPHHAWLISGPTGIGKASLAYQLAREILSDAPMTERAKAWLSARSHPDLHILELAVSDPKSGKLKSEIAVDDARAFADHYSRSAGQGGWRIGIVDCADQLNRAAANALLKLVEEPPDKALIFLVNHASGRLLPTLRSRCVRLAVEPLPAAAVEGIIKGLPLEDRPTDQEFAQAAVLSGGSPGRAVQLLKSAGAKAFLAFASARTLDAHTMHEVSGHFHNRATINSDYLMFMDLLQAWTAEKAVAAAPSRAGLSMATLSSELSRGRAETEGYNLDRRVAVLEALAALQNALMEA